MVNDCAMLRKYFFFTATLTRCLVLNDLFHYQLNYVKQFVSSDHSSETGGKIWNRTSLGLLHFISAETDPALRKGRHLIPPPRSLSQESFGQGNRAGSILSSPISPNGIRKTLVYRGTAHHDLHPAPKAGILHRFDNRGHLIQDRGDQC